MCHLPTFLSIQKTLLRSSYESKRQIIESEGERGREGEREGNREGEGEGERGK